MNALNDVLLFADGFLGGSPWFPYLLLGTGLFFTIYLGFPQIRFFGRAWRILLGKQQDPGAPGETTHFQALSTALSGTVGTGNIGGVGLAIYLGGPAALFWMWATAFLGMTTKFVEVTLGHKYREKTADGTMAGGPMYFMDKGLNLKPVAILFALATVISSFGSGSLPQINNIAQAMNETFAIEPKLTGAVLAVVLGLVIIGGIRRIASFAARIVPTMAVLYLVGATAVIISNFENIGPSLAAVFSGAFSGSAAVGGFLGATFAYVFNRGVNRGLYSNEAGQGSAPIAHASARTSEPVSEGMVSLLEPFIDTLIICTVTGLVILSSGVWTEKFDNQFQNADLDIVEGVFLEQDEQHRQSLLQYLSGGGETGVKSFSGSINIVQGRAEPGPFTVLHARSIAEDVRYFRVNSSGDREPVSGQIFVQNGNLVDADIVMRGESLIHSAALTTQAFTRSAFGEYGKYIVAIGLLLFAFSTSVAWSYYGDRAMTYLFGSRSVLPYRVLFVIAFFFGAFADTSLVWNFATLSVAAMTVPNVICLLLLRKEMRSTLQAYLNKTD